MPLDIAELLGRTKSSLPQVVFLPGPIEPAPVDPFAGQYFQIRLSEMYLSKELSWFREVAPAAFLQTEFNYGGASIKKPYFVSNSLLPDVPTGTKSLRARLSNTSVIGPVPYAGGDVVLFLGLFQTTLKDWRSIAFDVFEIVTGPFAVGPVSEYLKLAEKLSGKILECLGQSDVEAILADRHPLGKNTLPASGYWVYLRNPPPGGDPSRLKVIDDALYLDAGGGDPQRYIAGDYCLVQVERLSTRNDYTSMPFHGIWEQARQRSLAGKTDEAQGLMLDCVQQIFASPELTEGDKEALMKLYQAKLHAPGDQLRAAQASTAHRSGAPAMISAMQARAARKSAIEAVHFNVLFDDIRRLADKLEQQPTTLVFDERDMEEQLKQARRTTAQKPDPARLVRALALGTVATPDKPPR